MGRQDCVSLVRRSGVNLPSRRYFTGKCDFSLIFTLATALLALLNGNGADLCAKKSSASNVGR